jgi:hypothetical protein
VLEKVDGFISVSSFDDVETFISQVRDCRQPKPDIFSDD